MLKPFIVFFLLAAVITGTACKTSTSTPTFTPAPTANCTFTPLKFLPPGVWKSEYSPISIPGLAPNEYDPAMVLAQCQGYKPFADFYSNEIEPLGYTIHYFYNPTPPYGEQAGTTVDMTNRSANVTLGDISPNDDFAFLIAHELATIPTWINGYRMLPYNTQCGDGYERLDVAIQDVISTPLRDSILARYCFNTERAFYTFRIIPLFTFSPCSEPSDPLIVIGNACGYAELVLYWQVVLGNHGVPLIMDNLYKRCLPNSRAKGNEILAIIKQYGYDTSQEATTSYQAIIDKFHLQDCIRASLSP